MDSSEKNIQDILYCSQAGKGALFGSAPEATRWLLLEYRGPWGPKVLPYSSLPREVKDTLQHLTESIAGLKVLFIKKPERRQEPNLKLFLFSNRETARMRQYNLATHEDLLNLDLASFYENESASDVNSGNLFLVCTNGKRDRCCAKFGIPVYNSLCNYYGKDVWQCSHFGGHKYAPTFMHFPSGACYGRVTISDTLQAAEAILNGEILPLIYRGCTGRAKSVQAAEHLLRTELNNFRAKSVTLVHFTMGSDSRTTAVFKVDEESYEITIETKSGPKEWSGCNKAEPTATKQHRLIAYSRTNVSSTIKAI
ncbi:MAG: sucrase ferredoxin [Calditrichia bacterium]